MLEHPALLIRPWTVPAAARPDGGPGPGSTRDLLDTAGRPVGVARWQLAPADAWLPWLVRPTLTVHETDDEPLVFIVRRLWALTPSWEVCDADGNRVALLRRDWVWDRYGDCLAWLDRGAADGCRFHGRDGRELAYLSWASEDLRLEFGAELGDEPFVKMALLAAVLSGMAER
jgi:hypothetical protein